MSKTNNNNWIRLNVSIDRDLLVRADEYARANSLSRSGLIAVALSAYLNSQQMGQAMAEITALLTKLVNEGGTAEDFEKLEKIETLTKFLQG